MHVDPHLAPRLMEVQIGFDCEALHLSSPLTWTDVQWDPALSSAAELPRVRVRACERVQADFGSPQLPFSALHLLKLNEIKPVVAKDLRKK